MKLTNKRHVLKRIEIARRRVMAEIASHAKSGKYGAGLANEGFAGGYLEALNDVEAALRHGYPTDARRYWRED